MATLEAPVRRAIARRMGSRITNPLSQNTGIDTTQPMSSMARVGCFSPTRRMTMSASFNAAPVFSSTAPMKAPRMMTMPIDVKVAAKPLPMTPGTCFSGIPASSASTSEISRIARNGCTLSFEMSRIMATMATTKAMMRDRPVITGLKLQNSWQITNCFSIIYRKSIASKCATDFRVMPDCQDDSRHTHLFRINSYLCKIWQKTFPLNSVPRRLASC